MSISDLQKIRGLGKVKAIQLKCIAELSRRISRAGISESISFHDPAAVAEYYMETLRHEEQEVLVLTMLNSKGKLIRDTIISRGTVNASLILRAKFSSKPSGSRLSAFCCCTITRAAFLTRAGMTFC